MFTRRMLRGLTIQLLAIAAATPAESSGSLESTPKMVLNAGAQSGPSAIAARAEAVGKALAGTWVVSISQPGVPPTQRHLTFTSEGSLVSNDDLQLTPNGVEHFSIGQGNWIRTGARSVAATIAGQRYDLQGSLLGTFKVRIGLELNPFATAWTGTFRIDIILPGGQVVFSSGGTLEAVRLAVEPL